MTNNNTRTMAFQIDETLFQRIKAHLERETARTGRKLTQREFVLGLIERALDEAEQRAQAAPAEDQTQEKPAWGWMTSPQKIRAPSNASTGRIPDTRCWPPCGPEKR